MKTILTVTVLMLLPFTITAQKKNPSNLTQTGVVGKDHSSYISQNQHSELDKNGFGYIEPDPDNDLPDYPEMELWATQYYVHQAKYDENGYELKNSKEQSTGAKISLCDWCDAAVEGTVFTTDKEGKQMSLNYAKKSKNQQVNCKKCKKYTNYKNEGVQFSLWEKSKGKYGDGVSGYELIPYRTIAVDKTKIPIGTVIYIPAANGVKIKLPDGSQSTHDGYFFAADIGGDIKGNHIDVFTGLYKSEGFKFIKSSSSKTFVAYKVKNKFIEESLKRLHQ